MTGGLFAITPDGSEWWTLNANTRTLIWRGPEGAIGQSGVSIVIEEDADVVVTGRTLFNSKGVRIYCAFDPRGEVAFTLTPLRGGTPVVSKLVEAIVTVALTQV